MGDCDERGRCRRAGDPHQSRALSGTGTVRRNRTVLTQEEER